MNQKYTVIIISANKIEGEVYEFDTLKEAQEYAKARKELYETLYGRKSIASRMLMPDIYISGLHQLKKNKTRKSNEVNACVTGDIQRRMKKTYMRQIRRNCSRRDSNIIKCYEQAGLAHSLYNCLLEDDERLRESVQTLADNILNDDVLPTLIDIGYVF